MSFHGIDMTVLCKKDEVLEKLRANQETHSTIVAEARKGYVAKAKEALEARLDKLSSGKIVALSFSLRVPRDHTDVYDTAIAMLKLHQEDTIELGASEFRRLMEDSWEWMDDFLATNASYSGTARSEALSKGLDL